MEIISKTYSIKIDVEYKTYENIIIDIFKNDNLNYNLNDGKILNILGLYYQKKFKIITWQKNII